MSCIEFTVNGVKCSVDTRIPRDTSLNAYLRYWRALPGTKAMCHQGGCGACVVAVRARNPTSGALETFSVNSCLVLVFSCQDWAITTVEGLGSRAAGYAAIQQRTAQFNATQCGYCTAGWEMQLYSLLDKNLTMAELEDSFGSNTCRCTGYRPILDTAKSFAVDASAELCARVRDIEDLPRCGTTGRPCDRKCSTGSEGSGCSDWSLVAECTATHSGDIVYLDFGDKKYFKVFTEAQIFEIWTQRGVDSYMLVDGNTAKGILGTYEPALLIDIRDMRSLKQYEFDQNLVMGANVSLQDCIAIFTDIAKTSVDFAYLEHFVKHLNLVAHIPVRTIGSLAGNLMLKHKNPDFPSDIFVLFATVEATMTIRNGSSKKTLTMAQFLKQEMRGWLIVNFQLPPLNRPIFRSYKIMPRSQNASAIVNAGFLLRVDHSNTIKHASIVYGNISASFIHAHRTEAYLVGKNVFNNDVLHSALKVLEAEVQPSFDLVKQSPETRRKLAIGLFYKFILNISPLGVASPRLRSGGFLLERPLSSGKQDFQTDPKLYPLNQPLPKYEAIIQSSGEAQYANDLPPMKREVFGAFVLSTVASGKVDAIDASEVLKMDGVLALYTADDIPGVNSFGVPGLQTQIAEEQILATNNIEYHGQPVAIVVAVSEALANKVATQVKITYKNVSNTPPVLTIDDARKNSKRLVPSDHKIEPKRRGTDTTKVVKGVYEIGAQYHYYMEPLTCVAIPVDNGLEVYDSTQWIDLTQVAIARALDINESDVVVKVRRVGGAFGGKISRNVQVSTACALVAKKLDRPCRFILPLKTNLTIAGRRLPSQCEYEVGVDDFGKIQYLDASMIEDAGCSENEDLLAFTVGYFPNCYDKDVINLKLSTALTNTPSNTWARGAGTVEGISTIEHIMEHVAFEVGKDPTEVRLINMRTEDNDLPQLVDIVKKQSDYDRRYREIEQFNKANRWVKKAIKISVMLFPVQFYGNYSAFVSIYRGDGSVTVTTGGIEMGQGSNTKARQVCAYELGIPVEKVSVLPHYSFVAANNVFSGSSIVSESVCYSVIKACATLKERLKPIKDSLTNPTWMDVIKKAGEEEIDLVAEYMMTDKEPDISNYSAFAAAVLEGQLDVLTGSYIMNRLDIVEDAGLSTNPAIDVGQVEGAYVTGLSYFTMEKLIYEQQTGEFLTNDATNYPVYLAKDIPVDMRVTLRYNSKNKKGVLGAKAVGEMGMCTAHGVTHVLRQCIMESRKDSGYDPRQWINIDIPYTTESILKALSVKQSEFVITD